MKKFFAICSMIVALGFVAGCPSGDKPVSPPPASDAAPASNATEGGAATPEVAPPDATDAQGS